MLSGSTAGNPKANEQARAIANKDARGFDCKRDTAKHYGADARLVNERRTA